MRRRPLLLCACVFVLGLLYGSWSGWYLPILTGIIAVYAVLPYLTARLPGWALLRCMWIGAAFAAGVLHMHAQSAFRSAELAQIYEGKEISLCGEIYKKEIKSDQFLVYLKDCYTVSNTELTACNQVLLYQTSDDFSIGDILLANGKVNMFLSATNEGMFDAKGYYNSQKIDFSMKQADVTLLLAAQSPVAETMWHLRQQVADIYTEAADAITAGVLSVMVLGEKSTLDSDVKELYQSMGISHILAISGLHVSLVGLGLYRFLRRRGMRYGMAFALSGIFLYLYARMTGGSVSTRRAVGMLFLLMLADAWGRAYDSLNSLGVMILSLLWENPFLLEYAGFTLSVAAVLGVATVGAAIQVGEREEKLDMVRVNMAEEISSEMAEDLSRNQTSCGTSHQETSAGMAEDLSMESMVKTSVDKSGKLSADSSTTQTESGNRFFHNNQSFSGNRVSPDNRSSSGNRFSPDNQSFSGNRVSQNVQSSAGNHTSSQKGSATRKLMNAAYMGVGIWLFTLPLIATYYYEIPLYSALLNLFVVPLLKYLILLGIAGAVVGVIGSSCMTLFSSLTAAVGITSENVASDAAGSVAVIAESVYDGMPERVRFAVSAILYPCKLILNWYDKAANVCLNLPLAQIIVGKPSSGRIILYYLVFAVFALLWTKRKEQHWIRLTGVAVVLTILLVRTPGGFEVDVLDVGQGDGTYICTEEGTAVFIDGGSSNVSGVGTYRILPFLKSKGIQKISYWFVSHADADHISGLQEVLTSGYPIDCLVLANRTVEDGSWEALIQLAESAGTDVVFMKTGDALTMEQTEILCLSPTYENNCEDRNDGGLVLLYRDEQFSGMFAGDISSEVEESIIHQFAGVAQGEEEDSASNQKSNLLDVDFYKTNHHGSRYSSGTDWLASLTPQIATISCSSTNTYGHPHPDTLTRLEAVGADIYRTDELGEITIRMEDGEMVVSCFREE